MSSGKGGSQSTSVQIPKWLQAEAQSNLARANEIAKVGYTPYYGADVAAFTPMQQAAMQGTNQAAAAFGMPSVADPMAGMPQPQTFAGGVQGYSSAPMYQQSIGQLEAQRPAQYGAITSMFIDPVTGAQPRSPFSTPQPAVADAQGGHRGGGGGGGGGMAGPMGYQSSSSGSATPMGGGGDYVEQSRNASPYTSLADMFNGGGAGRSGSTFQGGPLSGTLNAVGVRPAGSSGSSSSMGSRK